MSNALSQKPPKVFPKVFSEIRPWLQQHYIALPKRLQRVAEFVLHNPDVVALNTIAVIRDSTRVTPSTLVRFARADVLHLEVAEQEVGGFRGLSATMCLALCRVLETGKRCS